MAERHEGHRTLPNKTFWSTSCLGGSSLRFLLAAQGGESQRQEVFALSGSKSHEGLCIQTLHVSRGSELILIRLQMRLCRCRR